MWACASEVLLWMCAVATHLAWLIKSNLIRPKKKFCERIWSFMVCQVLSYYTYSIAAEQEEKLDFTRIKKQC